MPLRIRGVDSVLLCIALRLLSRPRCIALLLMCLCLRSWVIKHLGIHDPTQLAQSRPGHNTLELRMRPGLLATYAGSSATAYRQEDGHRNRSKIGGGSCSWDVTGAALLCAVGCSADVIEVYGLALRSLRWAVVRFTLDNASATGAKLGIAVRSLAGALTVVRAANTDVLFKAALRSCPSALGEVAGSTLHAQMGRGIASWRRALAVTIFDAAGANIGGRVAGWRGPNARAAVGSGALHAQMRREVTGRGGTATVTITGAASTRTAGEVACGRCTNASAGLSGQALHARARAKITNWSRAAALPITGAGKAAPASGQGARGCSSRARPRGPRAVVTIAANT